MLTAARAFERQVETVAYVPSVVGKSSSSCPSFSQILQSLACCSRFSFSFSSHSGVSAVAFFLSWIAQLAVYFFVLIALIFNEGEAGEAEH